MNFLSRLQLWQKLALLVVAMAVPTLLLGTFYISQANETVSRARHELQGGRYSEALGKVLAEVVNHRGRMHALLNGDTSKRDATVASEADIDKLAAAVDAVDAEFGTSMKSTQAWQSVKSEWSTLRSNGSKLSADDNAKQHDALIARILSLGELVKAASQMNIDPEESTSVLIQMASEYVPQALINAGKVRTHAVRAAISGYLGADDRMAIQIYNEAFGQNLDSARAALERSTPDAKARLQPVVDAAVRGFEVYFSTIREKILTAQTMSATGAEIFDASGETTRALQELSTLSYAVMNTTAQQRLSSAVTTRNVTGGIALIALTVALGLSWLITKALSTPLAQAVNVFEKISGGRYDNAIVHAGTDEVGQVLRALDDMQGKLRSQIEAERSQAAENSRIRQALDKVSTNVLLADANHQIIYINETAAATFARTQGEIRKTLPTFDALRLRGASLDALSPEQAQQRRMLDTLSSNETQERTLGNCTFRTVANPVLGDKGERIGTVMEWTDRTQEVGVEKEMQSMLSSVIGGDLNSRISMAGKVGFFEAMSKGVNQLADNMADMVGKVKHAAGEVYRGAEEISQGNANLSQRTEEQSSSLEETASSMEEMTTTVKQNADNAGQANQLAVAARDQAEKGGHVVGKAVRAMTDINEASKKIADIIGVIDEIAFQTNLLALNAAVEAARAGEQGRGFAVVASEVRSLAGRSATAAKEIKELIQDSVRKVEDGSALVTQSGQTLEQIVASVKKVSDIVAEIAAASREQSSGIEQVNRAVTQMDELTQQNAALVEEATAASQAMASQARELNEMMDRYRISDAQQANAVATIRSEVSDPSQSPNRVERRSGTRPWGNRSARTGKTETSVAAVQPSARKLAAANGASDSDWTEF